MTDPNRQSRMTGEGEEIVFRPTLSSRIGTVIIKLIFVGIAAGLLYWSEPALRAYFERREITGAALHLERFDLSDRGVLAAMVFWCLFLAWWGLGGLYDIVKVHLQRDRFVLRPDLLAVHRRGILTRTFTFKPYEAMMLRLRPFDGALEATTNQGALVLTDQGTEADRKWLLDLLQQRYQLQSATAAPQQKKVETVATYRVERYPDGSVLIASTPLSTVGCAIMSLVVCIALAGLASWMLSKGDGSGFIPILFMLAFALAGLGSLNRRTVEASRGRLRVRWTSPVGRILARFVPRRTLADQTPFGEGEFSGAGGTLVLQTRTRQKGSTTHRIVLKQKAEKDPEFGDEKEESWHEDLILELSGNETQHPANYLIDLLSETTGFQRGSDSRTM